MSSPATSCARRNTDTASSYCSRKRELTMASRKLCVPGGAGYEEGRGGEPMMEVGSTTSAEALYMRLSLAAGAICDQAVNSTKAMPMGASSNATVSPAVTNSGGTTEPV